MINKIKDLLIVKDNFFKEDVYNKILKDISRLKFNNRSTTIDKTDKNADNVYQKIYFNVPLNVNHFAVQEVSRLLNNYGFTLNSFEHSYFLSTKHEEATPHCDYPMHVNCIIYLKGETILNSGTGFYDVKDNNYNLNRHIGFKENRAIIFDSNIFHASLQFNDGAKPRYMMANFFTLKKK